MRKYFTIYALLTGCTLFIFSCNQVIDKSAQASLDNSVAASTGGQENVSDTSSMKDIVKIAVGSNDHTSLVAALKQAELVTALANAGPFTVFAPTNDAFNKLPAGTVEGLMKDNKKVDLQNILQYHVTTSALSTDMLTDGDTLGMVNGDKITVSVKDGKITLNGNAHIIASVRGSNGWVHIIDEVLLPPAKK